MLKRMLSSEGNARLLAPMLNHAFCKLFDCQHRALGEG